jgi:branched-chain amino acid transport system ATP-binding protein
MSQPVLEATALEKSFGAVVAAADINVTVEAGARLSLIGANGAGKTTFVNIVTGYVKPTAGEIRLEGRDITGLTPRRITQLGVCRSFQIPQLCETMTPVENLLVAIGATESRASFFRSAHSDDRLERAYATLDRFGLEAYAERPVDELPGGVRKLVDIAMAMARAPRVLLLDEPTSGVSTDEKFPLMDCIMAAIDSADVAVIFVEHDMDIVTRYATRVLAFASGRIIADDRPDEVLSDVAVQKYVTGTAR